MNTKQFSDIGFGMVSKFIPELVKNKKLEIQPMQVPQGMIPYINDSITIKNDRINKYIETKFIKENGEIVLYDAFGVDIKYFSNNSYYLLNKNEEKYNKIIELMQSNDRKLYYYNDIRFLSGSAGYIVTENNRIILQIVTHIS